VTSPLPDQVEMTDDAENDLASHLAYLEAHNPMAALQFLDRVNHTLTLLASVSPRLDGAATHLKNGRRCRRMPSLPAVILYTRRPGVLVVLRVYHHARQPITR
jgi:plasmid stabilization system protein ParE